MPDKITFTIELNLQDLAAYRQIGEEDWAAEPVSFTQAVVDQAARQLVALLATDKALIAARDKAVHRISSDYAADRVRAVLEAPVRATNTYGEPTGAETTVTALIDAEITKQLKGGQQGYNQSTKSVLQRVIYEVVNSRLENDLKEAFNKARTEMLNAAAEVGKKALQAAVSRAFT